MGKRKIIVATGCLFLIVICLYVKLYLLLVLIVILIVSLIAALMLNKLYKQTNHYQNRFIDIVKFKGDQAFQLDMPHNLEIINLGSNQPKFAFDYSRGTVKGANWAVGPQTLEYDLMILKKFHSFLKEGASVVIPICPLKMFLYKYKNLNEVVKYYSVFDDYIIPDYSVNLRRKEGSYPLFFHPQYLRFLLKDVSKDERMKLQNNMMDEFQMEADADMWIENCWNREFDIDICAMSELSEENRNAIEHNVTILRKIIIFCIERGYHPIITYLPVSEYLSNKISVDFVDRYVNTYVEKAIGGYDVQVFDYLRDPRFQKNEYYINSFFMNRIGAKEFTEVFLKEAGCC